MTTDRFKFRVYLPDENRYLHNTDCPIIDHDGKLNWCYLNPFGHWEHHPMDNAVIEQCTGLTDKNGKLIFEGDILRFSTQFNVCVNFRSGGFVYSLYEDERLAYYLTEIISKSTQIIGNIHEMESKND